MLKTVGTFLVYWIGFTLGLMGLSLVMSGFVLVDDGYVGFRTGARRCRSWFRGGGGLNAHRPLEQ